MAGRADLALELQLEGVEKEAAGSEVKEAIVAALQHMRSSKSRQRRGGLKLVRLLQDALDYTTGRILKPDFEERYRIYQDGTRNLIHQNSVAGVLSSALHFAVGEGTKFLAERRDATPTEVLAHLASLGDDAKFLEAPNDQPGRYRIVRGHAEIATWLERVLRNRIDVEDPVLTASRLVASPHALQVFANEEAGQTLLKAAELKHRADALTKLRKITEDPVALEADLHRATLRPL